MNLTVTVGHGDISFAASADETVLDAAERAGFATSFIRAEKAFAPPARRRCVGGTFHSGRDN